MTWSRNLGYNGTMTKYKYQKHPTKKNWASAPSFNAYQIQLAVDVVVGDDGFKGSQIIAVLEHERKEAFSIKPPKGVDA